MGNTTLAISLTQKQEEMALSLVQRHDDIFMQLAHVSFGGCAEDS